LKNLLLTLLLCSVVVESVFAQETVVDTSDAYETRHYLALELPQKLWNVLIYPLGEFTIYAERAELPKRVRNWFTNEDHTFGFFPYVQLGGETGTGGGFSTFHTNLFDKEKEFAASYIFARTERQTAQALYRDPNVAGSGFYWQVEGNFLKTDNEDATINGAFEVLEDVFEEMGLGDEDLLLGIQRLDVGATLGWRPYVHELEEYQKNAYLETRLGFGTRELAGGGGVAGLLLAPGHTGRAALAPGLGEEIALFSIGGRIAYDDRDYQEPARKISHPLNYVFPGRVLLLANEQYYSFRDISYPERGGLLQVEADFVTGSEEVRFWRLTAEGQRFFTLFWRDRILGFRGRLEKVHRIGEDGIVPYADLPTLGGSRRMRGYKRGSFRGEGALLFSAEYRYPIWDTWNAFLFWDEGQVFDEYDQIETEEFHSCFGAGISIRTEEAFLVSFRIGHSEEEKALVGFSLEQEF